MKVNYYDEGIMKTMELGLGETDCPLCGQPIEKNGYKTQPKHPDFKCSNRTKGIDGKYECGCGFWIPKEKPKSVEKLKVNVVNPESAQLNKIIELLEKIETNTRL